MINNCHALTVGTFQLGFNQAVFTRNNIEFTEPNYRMTEQKTAAYFLEQVNLHNIDVLMFQGILYKDRPLLRVLTSQKFIYLGFRETQPKAEKSPFLYDNCAILIKASRFKDIENRSVQIDSEETPIVFATDKETNQRMLFVTAQVPGCYRDEGDSDAYMYGELYIANLIGKINELTKDKPVIQIFGAHMNTFPWKTDLAWDSKFRKLNNAGFLTSYSGNPTEIYFHEQTLKHRESSFIFSRNPGQESLKREVLDCGMDFDLQKDNLPGTSSNNIPVLMRFKRPPPPAIAPLDPLSELELDWVEVEDLEKK